MSKSAHWPPQIPFYRGFLENYKEPGTSFQATFFIKLFEKIFSFRILHKPDCVYFSSYSVKYVLSFTIRYLMTSWHLSTWKVKIWLSQEEKKLSEWNKKHLSLFHMLSFEHTKQTSSKNVADTTFEKNKELDIWIL